MYTDDDVDMFLQDKHNVLITSAWSEEYLRVHMQADYDSYGVAMLLSKEHAELLRDTLGVFLAVGYVDE